MNLRHTERSQSPEATPAMIYEWDLLEKANLYRWRTETCLPEAGVGQRGSIREFWSDGAAPCPDCGGSDTNVLKHIEPYIGGSYFYGM